MLVVHRQRVAVVFLDRQGAIELIEIKSRDGGDLPIKEQVTAKDIPIAFAGKTGCRLIPVFDDAGQTKGAVVVEVEDAINELVIPSHSLHRPFANKLGAGNGKSVIISSYAQQREKQHKQQFFHTKY